MLHYHKAPFHSQKSMVLCMCAIGQETFVQWQQEWPDLRPAERLPRCPTTEWQEIDNCYFTSVNFRAICTPWLVTETDTVLKQIQVGQHQRHVCFLIVWGQFYRDTTKAVDSEVWLTVRENFSPERVVYKTKQLPGWCGTQGRIAVWAESPSTGHPAPPPHLSCGCLCTRARTHIHFPNAIKKANHQDLPTNHPPDCPRLCEGL